MQQNIIDANAKVEQVQKILAGYVRNLGCLNTSMCDLREAFAKIISPQAPDFHHNFLALACTAITEDIRRGRHPYPIWGLIPANYDCMVGDPIILPGKYIFQDSKDVFLSALGKDWNTIRSELRVKEEQVPKSRNFSHRRVSREDSNTTPQRFIHNPFVTCRHCRLISLKFFANT